MIASNKPVTIFKALLFVQIITISPDICPEIELPCNRVHAYSILQNVGKLLSITVIPIYLPINRL